MNICPDATNSQEMKLLLMSKEKTVKGTQTISGREEREGIAREQVTAFSDQSSIVMSLTSTFPPDICHGFSSVHASHYQNKYSFRSPKYLYVKDRLELKRRTAAVWKVPSVEKLPEPFYLIPAYWSITNQAFHLPATTKKLLPSMVGSCCLVALLSRLVSSVCLCVPLQPLLCVHTDTQTRVHRDVRILTHTTQVTDIVSLPCANIFLSICKLSAGCFIVCEV